MNKPCACLGHSNPAEGFCQCDCGELAQTPQRNSAGQGAKIAAPVIQLASSVLVTPDFKPSILEQALFPVVGIWNVLVGAFSVPGFTLTALKWMAVFVFGIWAMPTTARKIFVKEDDNAGDHREVIFGGGLFVYPFMVTLITALALTIGAAGMVSDWSDAREHQRAIYFLFSTYVQPLLIPLAIANGLSLLYEIGRTKRKFAKAPQTPSVV